jgi:glycerol-3-phosphate acyltransferase PlsY
VAFVTDWLARLVGGREVRKLDGLTQEINPGSLESIRVLTDHPAVPVLDVVLDPSKGHHASVFTRVTQQSGLGAAGKMGVPVIHVVTDPAEPDRWVRVYLTPERIVISTRDLYW